MIGQHDRVASAGSDLAATIVPYLQARGMRYLHTEPRHPGFAGLPAEGDGYAVYSAAYGDISTARQLLQLLQRCQRTFSPAEDRWAADGLIIDAFRPGLRYPARSGREFDLLTRRHFAATRSALRQCSVFFFMLGGIEAWVSTIDGAVFPAQPGTIAGTFDGEKHAFREFTAAEVSADLDGAIEAFRALNESARVILAVSPTPLATTGSGRDLGAANSYGKAVLRVAAEQATRHAGVHYFPAYEIVTSPTAPADFFEADRRTVSQRAIDAVMAELLASGGADETSATATPAPIPAAAALSALITEFECDDTAPTRAED